MLLVQKGIGGTKLRASMDLIPRNLIFFKLHCSFMSSKFSTLSSIKIILPGIMLAYARNAIKDCDLGMFPQQIIPELYTGGSSPPNSLKWVFSSQFFKMFIRQ
jgi:hypothetical protein